MALIEAYDKKTGNKVQIPEHWLGHPRLGKPFRKTPPTETSRRHVEDTKPVNTPAVGDNKKAK